MWSDLWPDATEPLDLEVWDLSGPPPVVDGAGPDLVVLPYTDAGSCAHRLAEVPGLRVAQTLTAGYEDVLIHLPDGVTLCSAVGVHDDSTAELAVGLILAALRGIGQAARDALTGTWDHRTRPSLADRRVLVVGTGGIGEGVVARLAPFGVILTRVASRARDDATGHVHGVDELPMLLPAHDVVVLAVPLGPATRHLADARFLAAMPDGALLVNVARGPVVDTGALLEELLRGRLLAALDVTDPEPLPPDHPLWTAPGALVTPHVGGDTSAFPPRARRMLAEQLGRFARGEPLRAVVPGTPR
jgi:phosphoglycerate dehydrogenase-like enzyme